MGDDGASDGRGLPGGDPVSERSERTISSGRSADGVHLGDCDVYRSLEGAPVSERSERTISDGRSAHGCTSTTVTCIGHWRVRP